MAIMRNKNIVILKKHLADVDYNRRYFDVWMFTFEKYFFRNTDLKATFRVHLGMRWKLFPLLRS